ncbi:uncharacterized protein VP01_11346g1 [Puccinia sorghi]|uniref:Uncharacterized protein n=1 Tax=Puccinia sorghi TaxID=27349 RepID=A0A0L6VSB4_9BASI|nr:uncharacterized protein VP01_11346g1 [Puccinia sorghi]
MPPKKKFNQKTSTSKKSTPIPKKAKLQPTNPTTGKPVIQRNSRKNGGNNSSEDDSADTTAGHLTKEDYLVIIEWLKIKWNYDRCFGTGEAPAVVCPAKGKIHGFEMMDINL